MTSSLPATWYDLLRKLASLTKPVANADHQAIVDGMVDLVSDPALASKVVAVAERRESHLVEIAPELYWAAQLTLAGAVH